MPTSDSQAIASISPLEQEEVADQRQRPGRREQLPERRHQGEEQQPERHHHEPVRRRHDRQPRHPGVAEELLDQRPGPPDRAAGAASGPAGRAGRSPANRATALANSATPVAVAARQRTIAATCMGADSTERRRPARPRCDADLAASAGRDGPPAARRLTHGADPASQPVGDGGGFVALQPLQRHRRLTRGGRRTERRHRAGWARRGPRSRRGAPRRGSGGR